MPFISIKTNQDLAQSKELIKKELGTAITAIPGKSESWLMVEINDNKEMWFKGSDAPCAMFEVSVFGSAKDNAYDDLTKRLCKISQEWMSVAPDRTYIKYSEIEHWGYNGFNF